MNDDDQKLVNLQSFKQQKERQAKAEERKAKKHAGSPLTSPRVQKLIVLIFFLAIAWLAMPDDFVASIVRAVRG